MKVDARNPEETRPDLPRWFYQDPRVGKRPRWSPPIRPFVITSNPAIGVRRDWRGVGPFGRGCDPEGDLSFPSPVLLSNCLQGLGSRPSVASRRGALRPTHASGIYS